MAEKDNTAASVAAPETHNPENPTAEPAAQSQQDTTQATPKPDRRRKDPSEPNVVPFQLVTATNRARLAKVGKANDETLGKLLDAFEKGTAGLDEESQRTIARLQTELKDLNLKLLEADKSVRLNAAALQQRDKELKELQAELTAKKQEISGKDTEIAALKQQLQEKQAELDNAGNESDAEIQNTIKELKDRASKAEDQAKQSQELINGLNETKRELQARLSKAESDLKTAQDALLNVNNRSGDGPEEENFLMYFPSITAMMLERTAQKMTECRKDGKTVTPAMILGDMFNRYTVERWNLWFYKWVLTDDELIEIGKQVDERINSIRMLKVALNIK